MAFRDKVRGPLGWILGVVGGLALLAGSFFAGLATADNGIDQEQASVTEQQENQQDQDTDQDSDSKPEKGMRDGGKEDRGDRLEKGDGTEEGAEEGTENRTEDSTEEGTPERGPEGRHHDGKPDAGTRDEGRHSDGHHDGDRNVDGENTEEEPAA